MLDEGRFLRAQATDYETALQEIRAGRKSSHWIWYIFPQLRGLGRSDMANYFGLESLEDAKVYLAHPVLGARLREITGALQALETRNPLLVMGSPDHLKLCSCMPLFALCEEEDSLFAQVLREWYGDQWDEGTLRILGVERPQ